MSALLGDNNMEIVRGQKLKLGEVTPSKKISVDISLAWPNSEDIDIFCFGLNGESKLKDDRYLIFFNQSESPEGAVRYVIREKKRSVFDIDLEKLPDTIKHLTFTLSIDGSLNISKINDSYVKINANGKEAASFRFTGSDFALEKSLILFDIYLKDEWRISAVAQGFNEGSKALLEHFGGKAEEPKPKVSLSKITLDKRGDSKTVDLSKNKEQTFHVNLNWKQVSNTGGFLSGLFGNQDADLDLGCMYELQNGEKGVIQALGKTFGSKTSPPWILLDKDDRSGASSDGENLYVFRPNAIKKMIVFAYIYEGNSDFSKVDARVLIKDLEGNEITILLDNPDHNKTFCVVCCLKGSDSSFQIIKEERYVLGHEEADKAYGFGFRWRSGNK